MTLFLRLPSVQNVLIKTEFFNRRNLLETLLVLLLLLTQETNQFSSSLSSRELEADEIRCQRVNLHHFMLA